jgi:cytochrome b561
MPSAAGAATAGQVADVATDRYDSVEIVLHWATAVLVVVLYALAETWDFAPHNSAFQRGMQSIHVSFGLLLALVLVARVAWKAGPGRRVAPASSGLVQLATASVHYALYVLLAAEVVLGVLNRWGHHDPLSFFGAFTIPEAINFSKDQTHTINQLHNWVGNTIVILAGLHACAALAHHYVLHDGILQRMLPAARSRTAGPA